jgi:hypothetical protein
VARRLAHCPGLQHITTESAGDVDRALDRLAADGTRLIAINGGDGTVSAVLGRLLEGDAFEQPPLLAVLPAGTANNTAGDIGIRGSLVRAVDRFCDWCEGDRDTTGRIASRAVMRLCGAGLGTGPEPVYGLFLGGGAVIQGTEYAHEKIHSKGLRDGFSLALSTARTVWGVLRGDPRFNRHVTIELGLDGGAVQRYDTLILAASTLQRLSFGMRPFWGHGPGAIRLTLFEQDCTRFTRTFVSIARGRPNRNAVPASGYRSYNATTLHLALEGKLNLDGEMLEVSGPLQISHSAPLAFLAL